jgi:hypothetical protein
MRLALGLAFVLLGCSSEDPATDECSASDRDGDFLTGCEEAALGTDPANSDTDGDGYLDGDEVLEQKDPLDATSRIYQGGWPYQRNKADLVDPGFSSTVAASEPVPRLVALDQFGESVDLYDFAGHGKPVVIDLSAVWCDACKELAKWLEREPANLDTTPELAPIVDLVESGDVYWITVLFEDAIANPATLEEAQNWAEAFPNPRVAVLVDNERELRNWFFPGAMPSVHGLDDQMRLIIYERFDYKKSLAAVLAAER